MSIHLHIDRVVLEGVALHPAEVPLFEAAIRAHLKLALAARSARPMASFAVDRAGAGSIALQPGAPALGAAVAANLCAGPLAGVAGRRA